MAICFKINPVVDKKDDEELEKIKNELSDFFKLDVKEPIIFYVNSREDMNSVWGRLTEDWFVGATKNNNIYIFEPSVFDKVSTHEKKDFLQTLKHEYSHIFFNQITNNSFPFWLNEGLACHLSGKKNNQVNAENLFNIFSYFKQGGKGAYNVSQFWVELLLKEYGKEKLLDLIKSIRFGVDEEDFKNLFHKIYGINFNKADFLQLLNKKELATA